MGRIDNNQALKARRVKEDNEPEGFAELKERALRAAEQLDTLATLLICAVDSGTDLTPQLGSIGQIIIERTREMTAGLDAAMRRRQSDGSLCTSDG